MGAARLAACSGATAAPKDPNTDDPAKVAAWRRERQVWYDFPSSDVPLIKTLTEAVGNQPAEYQFRHLSFQEGLFVQGLLKSRDTPMCGVNLLQLNVEQLKSRCVELKIDHGGTSEVRAAPPALAAASAHACFARTRVRRRMSSSGSSCERPARTRRSARKTASRRTGRSSRPRRSTTSSADCTNRCRSR